MTSNRLGRIWELVAEQAAGHGTGVTAGDVCAAVVTGVQVTGAWLSAGNDGEPGHLMRVTDAVSGRLAELQLTLGEGPSLDASASGGPALASDLADGESGRRWPAFAPAACQAGAAAIFAFPLAVGAIRAGVLSLYRDRPGRLSDFQLGDALLFADTATLLLLDAQTQGQWDDELALRRANACGRGGPGRSGIPGGSGGSGGSGISWGSGISGGSGGPGGQPAVLAGHRAEIDQATGMLTEQLGVGIADAFARLRAYAYANDRQLADVARDIVARRLRLSPRPAPPPPPGSEP